MSNPLRPYSLLLIALLGACDSPPSRRGSREGTRIWNPHIILDQGLSVAAGGSGMEEFSLPTARNIQIAVSPALRNAGKFSVYVMRKSEWEAYRAHQDFMHVDAFQGSKVTSLEKTAGLDSGVWLVVVENPKGASGSVSVKVRVTADPAT